MATELNKYQAKKGQITLDPDGDLIIDLEVPPGEAQWPSGTTAYIRFFAGDGKAIDSNIVKWDMTVVANMISLKKEQADLSVIPAGGCNFKIAVSLSTTSPSSEYPLWEGPVTWKVME